MRGKDLLRYGLVAGFAWGCNTAPTLPAIDAHRNTLTSSPVVFTPTLTMVSPTETSTPIPPWFGTPMAKNTAIQQTVEAVNPTALIESGFPQKAFDSLISVKYAASGNVMHESGWWIIIQSGHVQRDVTLNNLPIFFAKDANINSPSQTFFQVNEWGGEYIYNEHGDLTDIGVIVIPDKHGTPKLGKWYDVNKILTRGDIDFSPISDKEIFSVACFPIWSKEPTVVIESRFEGTMVGTLNKLKRGLVTYGCSSGGVFNEQNKLKGIISLGNPGDQAPVYLSSIDDIDVYSLSQLGASGFDKLISKAKQNYWSKNQNSHKR